MSHDEVERSLDGGGIRPGIMHILGQREPSIPCGLVVVNEDAEVLFKPLVCTFELAIRLRVVSSAYILFNI